MLVSTNMNLEASIFYRPCHILKEFFWKNILQLNPVFF